MRRFRLEAGQVVLDRKVGPGAGSNRALEELVIGVGGGGKPVRYANPITGKSVVQLPEGGRLATNKVDIAHLDLAEPKNRPHDVTRPVRCNHVHPPQNPSQLPRTRPNLWLPV